MKRKVLVMFLAGAIMVASAGCAGNNAAEVSGQAEASSEADAGVQAGAEGSGDAGELEDAENKADAGDGEDEDGMVDVGSDEDTDSAAGAGGQDAQEASDTEAVNGTAAETVLPPYEYPGPELFYHVLYQYMIDEFSPYFDAEEGVSVGIPCPDIVAEDESDKDDIKVWGDFLYYNYELNGDILETKSGGSFPGCIHIKSTDEGYEVTGIDLTEDGAGFDSSAKKIFGKYYDEFIKKTGNREEQEKLRAQIIANYVAANELPVTAVQDYGWEPVELPEENIDSFYSTLN